MTRMKVHVPSFFLQPYQPNLVDVPPQVLQFEKHLGHTFTNKRLLQEALTHASQYNATTPSYQRLEFLGDAVLDFLITEYLYEQHSKEGLTPGLLTDMRQVAVCNSTFALLAMRNGFNRFLFYTSEVLFWHISQYQQHLAHQEEVWKHKLSNEREKEKEKEGTEGVPDTADDSDEDDDFDEKVVPKVLGDVFESVAAAIFIDSGGDMGEVWRVYYPMMKEFLEQRVTPSTLVMHPKRRLLEHLQSKNCKKGEFRYQLHKEAKDVHHPHPRGGTECCFYLHGEVIGVGVGRNKRSAAKKAAERAVGFLNQHPNYLASHCICHS